MNECVHESAFSITLRIVSKGVFCNGSRIYGKYDGGIFEKS